MARKFFGSVLVMLCLTCSAIPVNSADDTTRSNDLVVEVLNSKHIYSSSEIISLTVRTNGQTISSQYEIEWILFEGYSQNGTFIKNGSISWVANTIIAENIIELSEFYDGHLKYTLILMVFEDGLAISESEFKFMIFRDNIQEQIGDFLVFGDSISDQGNSFSAFGTPQSPPYYSGRFSNGPVWAEKVATEYGKTLAAGNFGGPGTNRAFGGAQTGNGMSFLIIPNVGEQIDRYLSNVNSNINQNDLIFLFAGGNDFVFGAANPNITLQNMVEHANTLADAGGKKFVVVNLPPIEKTPTYSSNTPSDIAQAGSKVSYYNTQLPIEMSSLALERNISIQVIDIYSMFNEIYYNGTFGGITNVVDEACGYTTGSCNSNDIAPNPDEFMFWDYIHPTRVIHDALAELMLQEIGLPDTDGDSIEDGIDLCEWTPKIESANTYGCSPSQLDDDEDGVKNGADLCPNTGENYTVDSNGCADYQKDSDQDGVYDDIDFCPNTIIGNNVDAIGCADYQKDSDGDSVTDDVDLCPNTIIGEEVDEEGCATYQRDSDGDEVTDNVDLCPSTESNEIADENGCANYQKDSDSDSITDDKDLCANTNVGSIVNLVGCALYQLDSDSDTVNDEIDQCPQTIQNMPVDENGCADYEKDSDYDEIMDDLDICPETLQEYIVDQFGCADYQKDSDYDGYNDEIDPCPLTYGNKDGCPIISITTYTPSDQTIFLLSEEVNYKIYVSCDSGCSMDIFAYPYFLADTDINSYLIAENRTNGTIEFTMDYTNYNVEALSLEILAKSGLAQSNIENTVYFVERLPEEETEAIPEEEEDGLSGVFESGKEFVADSGAVVILLNIGLVLAIIFVLVLLIKTPKNEVLITSQSDMMKTTDFEVDESQSLFNADIAEKESLYFTEDEFIRNMDETDESSIKEDKLDIEWLDELI